MENGKLDNQLNLALNTEETKRAKTLDLNKIDGINSLEVVKATAKALIGTAQDK